MPRFIANVAEFGAAFHFVTRHCSAAILNLSISALANHQSIIMCPFHLTVQQTIFSVVSNRNFCKAAVVVMRTNEVD